jgi:hypothetical protein
LLNEEARAAAWHPVSAVERFPHPWYGKHQGIEIYAALAKMVVPFVAIRGKFLIFGIVH